MPGNGTKITDIETRPISAPISTWRSSRTPLPAPNPPAIFGRAYRKVPGDLRKTCR
jgi:hypothetical protein